MITPQTKITTAQDTAWEILDEIKDLLPEAAGKLVGWVGFFKEAKDNMETVRDAIFLPASADDVYARYAAERRVSSPDDTYGAYDRAVTGRLAQIVRSAPEFQRMSDEQFTRVFRQRLEARYQMAQLEQVRAEMAANPTKVIAQIVLEFDDKINSVHSTCEEIAGSRR